MKIIKEIDINKNQKILVIEDKETTSIYITDVDYCFIALCFGVEKDKFNFSDERLIEIAKRHFELYYKDIKIVEDYWSEHDAE